MGVNGDELKTVKDKKRNMVYFCQRCDKPDFNDLVSKFDKLQKAFEDLQTVVSKHQDDLASIKSQGNLNHNNLEDIISEIGERHKRSCNFLIHGAVEKTSNSSSERHSHDVQIVTGLLNQVSETVPSFHVTRLGKPRTDSNRPRPLKVILGNPGDALEVIKQKARNPLKEYLEKNSLTVSADLTPLQRDHMKNLIEELKLKQSQGENVVIKYINGVPRIVTPKRQFQRTSKN